MQKGLKGDRSTHEFGISSEKGTGLHIASKWNQKRGQVHTWIWSLLRKGDRSAHELELATETGTGPHMSQESVHPKGTGLHTSLESAQKRGQVCT